MSAAYIPRLNESRPGSVAYMAFRQPSVLRATDEILDAERPGIVFRTEAAKRQCAERQAEIAECDVVKAWNKHQVRDDAQ